MRSHRRDFTVRGRCDPGKLLELPGEMCLVAIAGCQSHVHERSGTVCSDARKDLLKPYDPTIEFRCQPNRPPEQGNESPVTVPTLLHYFVYIGGDREPFEGVRRGRVKPPQVGKPRRLRRSVRKRRGHRMSRARRQLQCDSWCTQKGHQYDRTGGADAGRDGRRGAYCPSVIRAHDWPILTVAESVPSAHLSPKEF